MKYTELTETITLSEKKKLKTLQVVFSDIILEAIIDVQTATFNKTIPLWDIEYLLENQRVTCEMDKLSYEFPIEIRKTLYEIDLHDFNNEKLKKISLEIQLQLKTFNDEIKKELGVSRNNIVDTVSRIRRNYDDAYVFINRYYDKVKIMPGSNNLVLGLDKFKSQLDIIAKISGVDQLKDLISRVWNKEIVSESMYSRVTYEKVKKPAAKKVESNNDIYIDISEERANMVAVTLKGRTALIPAERAQKIAEKLMSLSGTILAEQEKQVDEENVSVKNNFGIENAEDHTQNDPPGTSNKGVSARKGFVG